MSSQLNAQKIGSVSDVELPGLVKDAVWDSMANGVAPSSFGALASKLLTGRISTADRRAVWTAEFLTTKSTRRDLSGYPGYLCTWAEKNDHSSVVASIARLGWF
jgi:hypothetical protein